MAAVPAIVVPLKELVARSGPPVMGPGTGYYPSGHTATAVVAYGAATLLLLPWLRRTYARRLVLTGCLTLNAAVGVGLVRPRLPLAAGRGGQLVSVRGAADPAATVRPQARALIPSAAGPTSHAVRSYVPV